MPLFFSFFSVFLFFLWSSRFGSLYHLHRTLFFSSHYGFFYINHAIVTPLHPFGLLVSKKDYIYPCSRYANNPYTLVAHCFLSSFLSFSLSVPLLLCPFSSLSLVSSFPLLSIPFPLTWITGFLLRYAHLVFPSLHFISFFPVSFFFFFPSSLQTQIVCEREHNLCSWIISLSLSLSSLSTTIAIATSLFNFSPYPPPRLFSPYFPFTLSLPSTPSYLFLNRPNSILALSLYTPNPPTINQSAFLPSFLLNGIPRREYEKNLLIMCNFCFFILCYIHIYIYLISVLVLVLRSPF